MASSPRKRVAIIGAGICGVSSAICLQEADASLELTIIAEKFSPNLVSDGAAGYWEPYLIKDTPKEKLTQWGKSTFDYLKSILDTEEAYKYQMNYITNFTLFDYIIADVSEEFPFADAFVHFDRLSKEQLKKNNFPPDIIDGFIMKSIMFPGTPYLNIKLKEFQQRGGKIIQKKVNSFDELAGRYDVVVNCTGIGARDLCNDHTIFPTRGQVLKMKAPWLKHGYFITKQNGDITYIFPRFNNVVVGGTAEVGNWDTNVDDEQTQAIIKRAADYEPTIKQGVLVKPWVGLRPSRDAVCLEKEIMQVQSKHGTKMKLQVVHNYGHGGGGLSLFWGCAEEVRDLVLSSLLHSTL